MIPYSTIEQIEQEWRDRLEAAVRAEREACIDIIENHRISVGNSLAGELAREWTYGALMEIRDEIRARGEQ